MSCVLLVKYIFEHFMLARHWACYSCLGFLNFYGLMGLSFFQKHFFFSYSVLIDIGRGREVIMQSLMEGEEEVWWLALALSILDTEKEA